YGSIWGDGFAFVLSPVSIRNAGCESSMSAIKKPDSRRINQALLGPYAVAQNRSGRLFTSHIIN
ncbi:MAG: hypothetical protein KC421_19160, partial [Anaerolineales bacterium]|nr:hypothetical protein [Anaerolineales bacterium]